MTDLKQQLHDVGLAGTVTLTETGEQLTFNFARGETSKHVSVVLGGIALEGSVEFEENVGAAPGAPTLTLVIRAPLPGTVAMLPPEAMPAAPVEKLADDGIPAGGVVPVRDTTPPEPSKPGGFEADETPKPPMSFAEAEAKAPEEAPAEPPATEQEP